MPLFVSAGAFLGVALGLMSGQWLLMIAMGTGLGWLVGRQWTKPQTEHAGPAPRINQRSAISSRDKVAVNPGCLCHNAGSQAAHPVW